MSDNLKQDYKILDNVQGSIRAFDSKAGILISIIGIAFGLSLSFLDFYSNLNILFSSCSITRHIYDMRRITFSIIYSLYLLFGLGAIISSLFVFYPRKNNKNSPHINVNYYWDLTYMNIADYLNNKNIWLSDEKTVWDQIKRNSEICKTKHKFLIRSIILFILFLIFLIALTILYVLFIKY